MTHSPVSNPYKGSSEEVSMAMVSMAMTHSDKQIVASKASRFDLIVAEHLCLDSSLMQKLESDAS